MSTSPVPSSIVRHRVRVQIGTATLEPKLTLPEEPRALVLVANASGDRTYDSVNRTIAASLWAAGFATLEASLVTDGDLSREPLARGSDR
jgi:hypothetical protein